MYNPIDNQLQLINGHNCIYIYLDAFADAFSMFGCSQAG